MGEPVEVSKFGHSAWSDEEFTTNVNQFAMARYPFKEISAAALDAGLSASQQSSGHVATALRASNPVADPLRLRVMFHRMSQSLAVAGNSSETKVSGRRSIPSGPRVVVSEAL